VIVLDTSIITMALPVLAADMALSERQLSWVINGYLLTFGGFLLLGGRLADVVGPRRTFLCGLVVFGTASLAGGLAPHATWLTVARALQGFGGALMSPAALAMLTRLFAEGPQRNRALGIWGAVAAAGAPTGGVVGGILTEALNWSWVLLINVPVCAAALALSLKLLPGRERSRGTPSFDTVGATTATAGLGVLVYALVDGNRAGWVSTQTLVLLGLAVVLLIAFLLTELYGEHPLVPLGILAHRSIRSANAVALIGGMPQYGMGLCLALYLQDVLGYGPIKAGLAFLPFGATSIISARAASGLVTQFGVKRVMVLGAGFMATGLLPLVTITASGGYLVRVLPALLFLAVGIALLLVATTVAGLSGTTDHEAGLGGGLITTSQQLGGALGLAITVAVLDAATDASGLVHGLRIAFAADAALAVCATVAAATIVSSRTSHAYARSATTACGADPSV
jgi:EmrB/QacA subfamily drug resistance transporter